MSEREITIVWPHPPDPSGGPGTFQQHVIDKGSKYGIRTVDESHRLPDCVLVTAGTRRLWWLWRLRRRGVRVVQRLDGVNWRDYLQPIGLRSKLRAYLGSRLVAFIRRHLADHIVYQSEFVRDHWDRAHGRVSTPTTVVLNGTDLRRFKPAEGTTHGGTILLCVEGSFQPGTWVPETISEIADRLIPSVLSTIRLIGRMDEDDKARLECIEGVDVMGEVPRKEMPDHYRDAQLFLNLEVHPPCPNSVVEALASGLPVASFDTGAARELVGDSAGILVPYGSDPWKLQRPDIEGLVVAIEQLAHDRGAVSALARERAKERLSTGQMLTGYGQALNAVLDRGAS